MSMARLNNISRANDSDEEFPPLTRPDPDHLPRSSIHLIHLKDARNKKLKRDYDQLMKEHCELKETHDSLEEKYKELMLRSGIWQEELKSQEKRHEERLQNYWKLAESFRESASKYEQENENLREANKILREENSNFASQISELLFKEEQSQIKVAQLENQLGDQRNTTNNLTKENQKIQLQLLTQSKELKDLNEERTKYHKALLLGQFAFTVEKRIIKHIKVNETFSDWVEFKDSLKNSEDLKKFEDLSSQFDPRFEVALRQLRQFRVPYAHPVKINKDPITSEDLESLLQQVWELLPQDKNIIRKLINWNEENRGDAPVLIDNNCVR